MRQNIRTIVASAVVIAAAFVAGETARAEGICWNEQPVEGASSSGCVLDHRITDTPTTEINSRVLVSSSTHLHHDALGNTSLFAVARQDRNTSPSGTYRQTGSGVNVFHGGDTVYAAYAHAGVWQTRSAFATNPWKQTYSAAGANVSLAGTNVGAGMFAGQTTTTSGCSSAVSGNVIAAGQGTSVSESLGECPVEVPDVPDLADLP